MTVINSNKSPLEYEPSNEQELIFLFAHIYKQLNLKIVHVRGSFPDCIAKDANNKEVKIEFELYSSNFILHGHSANKCDYIICWQNDAKINKPKVIELHKYFPKIKKIKQKTNINISKTIISNAITEKGIAYNELVDLFKLYNRDEFERERYRVIGRLFMWGCKPRAEKGYLKINKTPPEDKKGAIRDNEEYIQIAENFLDLLKDQWEFYTKK